MEFLWGWGDDRHVHHHDRVLRRLQALGERLLRVEMLQVETVAQNRQILALLQPDPASVRIIPFEGAPVADITIAPGETQTFTYAEFDADNNPIVPLVGTPSWNVPDGTVVNDVDNGDNTVGITGGAEGTTTLELTVTYPSGNTGTSSDAVTCVTPPPPVPDPARVEIVAA